MALLSYSNQPLMLRLLLLPQLHRRLRAVYSDLREDPRYYCGDIFHCFQP